MGFTKAETLVKESKVVLDTILKHFPNSAFCDASLDPNLRKEIEELNGRLAEYVPKKPKRPTYKKREGTRYYPKTGYGIPTADEVRAKRAAEEANSV